jgi:hypothetical protein
MRAAPALTALLAALLAGCQDRPGPAVPPAATASPVDTVTPPTYTRAMFRDLVMGKTPAEVTAAVGKPDRTVVSGTADFWYYDGRTTNPATGKADNKVQLVFRVGKVAEINY